MGFEIVKSPPGLTELINQMTAEVHKRIALGETLEQILGPSVCPGGYGIREGISKAPCE